MAKEDIEKHRFKKGQSGNPKGRPKNAKNRSTIVKEIFEVLFEGRHPFTGETVKMTLQEWMINKQVQKAIAKGDTKAYTVLSNQAHGNTVQRMDVNADVPKIDLTEFFKFKE
mgnify:FL=1|jgi:hypothetical protein|tara:strand:- start:141 stop:476 length:336 start_codon:yes stop_codon:yes gene_type:complete